uniref:Minor capsid protein P8 central region domain-containing protein n=1 Tax=viral metagenome TaxID=1070528 RepID=A0A6C0KBC8_9ZZZZ
MDALYSAINRRDSEPLALLFFDNENYVFLENYVTTRVSRDTGSNLASQEPRAFVALMEYIYNNYSACNPDLRSNLLELNKLFLRHAIKKVTLGYEDYRKYYKDASTLRVPGDRPVNSSSKGSKGLQERFTY